LVSKPPAFFASQHFLAVVELVVEPAETLPRHHWSTAKFVVKFNQVGDGVFFSNGSGKPAGCPTMRAADKGGLLPRPHGFSAFGFFYFWVFPAKSRPCR
jgi:hypothetical protein